MAVARKLAEKKDAVEGESKAKKNGQETKKPRKKDEAEIKKSQ